MNLTRYHIHGANEYGLDTTEGADGEWVKWEDVLALATEHLAGMDLTLGDIALAVVSNQILLERNPLSDGAP